MECAPPAPACSCQELSARAAAARISEPAALLLHLRQRPVVPRPFTAVPAATVGSDVHCISIERIGPLSCQGRKPRLRDRKHIRDEDKQNLGSNTKQHRIIHSDFLEDQTSIQKRINDKTHQLGIMMTVAVAIVATAVIFVLVYSNHC